jgi:hypothetical protein
MSRSPRSKEASPKHSPMHSPELQSTVHSLTIDVPALNPIDAPDSPNAPKAAEQELCANPSTSPVHKGFFATKKGAALIGGIVGSSAYAATLYAAPAVVQAATYAVAGALASILGASASVYLGAMIAVALAAALVTALVAVAVRAVVDHFANKTTVPASEAEAEETLKVSATGPSA